MGVCVRACVFVVGLLAEREVQSHSVPSLPQIDFTVPGKILCCFFCVVGIALFAIPIGTLFEAFGDVLAECGKIRNGDCIKILILDMHACRETGVDSDCG